MEYLLILRFITDFVATVLFMLLRMRMSFVTTSYVDYFTISDNVDSTAYGFNRVSLMLIVSDYYSNRGCMVSTK